MLNEHFAKYGPLQAVSRTLDKIKNKLRNYGFVAFRQCEGIVNALADTHTVRLGCVGLGWVRLGWVGLG